MATGKNKLLRYARIYVGGYDLSGDARTFDSAGFGYGDQEMTGWSDTVYKFLTATGMMAGIRGFRAFMNDTASSGAFSVLKHPYPAAGECVSLLFGGGGAPGYGDPAYILSAAQIADPVGLDGSAHLIGADFLAYPVGFDGNPFGIVLYPLTSISATTNGTSHNNGAGTTAGWHANLHVTATSSGNFAIKIEHSTDNAAWATLGTFTTTAGSITAEYLSGSGTVNQYVRLVATRTAGTISIACAFARK